MSYWVHVAAIARVDSFVKMDFEKEFGKEVRFDSDTEVWQDAEDHPEKYLPLGSEGSLRMSVWETPEENHLAKYTVSIFGDLRDVFGYKSIINWFKDKIKDMMIRQASITVDTEGDTSYSWVYGGAEIVDDE